MQSLRAGQRSCAAQGSRGNQAVTSHCRAPRRPFSSSQSSAFGCALSSATQAGLPGQSTAQPSQPITRAARGSSSIVCQAAPAEKMTVAITGATGLVGSRLVAKLTSQGHKVKVLTRNVTSARSKMAPYAGVECFAPSQWAAAIVGCTGVVNLAGEPIGTRWTPEIKAEIKRSRLTATNAVVDAIAACPAGQRPSVLVSASAVGYYGNSYSASFNEDSAVGNDYLAEVCREWEAAARRAPSDVRLCIMRVGIVLARDGGALGKMMPVFQIFAGGPLGSGRQWMSWIHRDDLVELLLQALRNPSYQGVYNATAPKPVTMGQLCSALGTIMGRPSWLPVPDFALQTLLGEGAKVVLEGQRVLPSRTQQAGFAFKYSDVSDALKEVLR